MSLREAARQAGCSAGYLSNVTHGRKPLTPSVAARLDRALGTGDLFTAYTLNPGPDKALTAGTDLAQAQPEGARRDGQRNRDASQRARDAAGARRDWPPLTAWAENAVGAERDALRLWNFDLDLRGSSPGSATAVTSAVLTWLTAPPKTTRSRASGGIEVSRNDVGRVRAVRARLKDLDNAHGGGVAFPLAVAYLRDEAAALLRGSCDQVTRAALLAAITEAELDAGCFGYDAGDHQLARSYLVHALRMAQAAGSRLLGARIVCALSHQALHVGQIRLSVDLARAARAGAGAEATPRATAMLAAMEAMAHGAAGDAVRCDQALSEAGQALARATADDGDPDWLDFDEGGLLGHTARAHRDLAAAGLSAPDYSMRFALQSAGLCRADHRRTRAQRNAILATACVQAGEIDHAAAVGELIVADAWDLRSRHVQEDIASLLARIEPAQSSPARDFTDLAREFLATRARPEVQAGLSR